VTIFPFKIIVLEQELYARSLSLSLSLSSKASFIIGHAIFALIQSSRVACQKGIAIVWLFMFPQLFGDGSLKFGLFFCWVVTNCSQNSTISRIFF
jgi:hypothetical protein